MLLLSDMDKDWRFKRAPHIEQGGMRSYAGTPLRCRTEDGDEVAFGSLCVLSNTTGLSLSTSQQDALVRFADMIVLEIVNHSRWSRQRQQLRMNELIAKAIPNADTSHIEAKVLDIATEIYPDAQIQLILAVDQGIPLSNDQTIPLAEVNQGIYEDSALLASLLLSHNHQELTTTRYIRAIVAKVWARSGTRLLVVASKDIRLVFDDVDARFVERCASTISNVAQERSLSEALQVKEEFLRGVTHQLRTPLHGVLGSVDLLAEELAASRISKTARDANGILTATGALDTAEILRTIRNSGQELMSTVNNIIKLHRWAETSDPDRITGLLTLAELESQIVDDVSAVVADDASSKLRLLFDNQLPADIGGIMTDATLLRECLQSLVLNALQATSSGDVVITVSTPEDRSLLQFDVEDTGCGIPAADQQRIFRAYEKSDIHTRGIGLGLTLASRMATAMNGRIYLVSSAEGKGSHFRAEFQNPAFSGEIPPLKDDDAQWLQSPARLHIPDPQPATLFHQHLVGALRRRCPGGESSTAGCSIALVEYTSNNEAFQDALHKSKGSEFGLCLLPAGEPVEHLRSLFPRVTFATGPFTTKRLTDILLHLCQLNIAAPLRANSIFDIPSLNMAASSTNKLSTSTMSRRRQPNEPLAPYSLLVDDNLVNLRILRMYCDKRKFSYSLAADGLEAIEAYKAAADSRPVKLVLLDLQMPRCNGLQACVELRAFEKVRGLDPAIIFVCRSS